MYKKFKNISGVLSIYNDDRLIYIMFSINIRTNDIYIYDNCVE